MHISDSGFIKKQLYITKLEKDIYSVLKAEVVMEALTEAQEKRARWLFEDQYVLAMEGKKDRILLAYGVIFPLDSTGDVSINEQVFGSLCRIDDEVRSEILTTRSLLRRRLEQRKRLLKKFSRYHHRKTMGLP